MGPAATVLYSQRVAHVTHRARAPARSPAPGDAHPLAWCAQRLSPPVAFIGPGARRQPHPDGSRSRGREASRRTRASLPRLVTARVFLGVVEAAATVVSDSSRGPRFTRLAAPQAALPAHLGPAASGGYFWPVKLQGLAPGSAGADPAGCRPCHALGQTGTALRQGREAFTRRPRSCSRARDLAGPEWTITRTRASPGGRGALGRSGSPTPADACHFCAMAVRRGRTPLRRPVLALVAAVRQLQRVQDLDRALPNVHC